MMGWKRFSRSLACLFLLLLGQTFSDESTCDAASGECNNSPSLLLSDDTRSKLAEKLNQIIDIPILGERHELFLAEKLIDMCLSAFGDDDEDFIEMKREIKWKLVRKLNKVLNVPFANEKQEERILSKIVDFVLKDSFTQDAEKDDGEEATEE